MLQQHGGRVELSRPDGPFPDSHRECNRRTAGLGAQSRVVRLARIEQAPAPPCAEKQGPRTDRSERLAADDAASRASGEYGGRWFARREPCLRAGAGICRPGVRVAPYVRRQQSGRCRRGCCSRACYSGVRRKRWRAVARSAPPDCCIAGAYRQPWPCRSAWLVGVPLRQSRSLDRRARCCATAVVSDGSDRRSDERIRE
jgi:hypothetical protein